MVKVAAPTWLEFDKPDLARAEPRVDLDRLASATGSTVTARRGGYAVELTGLRPLIEDPP